MQAHRRERIQPRILIALLCLVLTSCYNTLQISAPDGENFSLQGRWTLIEIPGVESVWERGLPYVVFDENSSSIQGFSGCNRISGEYKSSAKFALEIQSLTVTKMACLGRTDENLFLERLSAVRQYSIVHMPEADSNEILTLQTSTSRPLLVFQQEGPG